MKRATKMILFIVVAAITFGSLNHYIGRSHCGNGFRNQHGYERPWQGTEHPANVPAQRI